MYKANLNISSKRYLTVPQIVCQLVRKPRSSVVVPELFPFVGWNISLCIQERLHSEEMKMLWGSKCLCYLSLFTNMGFSYQLPMIPLVSLLLLTHTLMYQGLFCDDEDILVSSLYSSDFQLGYFVFMTMYNDSWLVLLNLLWLVLFNLSFGERLGTCMNSRAVLYLLSVC